MNTQNKTAKPSRKAKVKALFNVKDPAPAWTLGRKLGLKESTLTSWFGFWRREQVKAAAEKRKAKPKVAKPKATKEKAMQEAKAKPVMPEASNVEPAPTPAAPANT